MVTESGVPERMFEITKRRERTIAFDMSYCQNYKPKPGLNPPNYCEKNMDISSLRVPGGGSKPCIDGHELPDATAVCPHWIRRTREMGEARADRLEKTLSRMTIASTVVGTWRTWTKKNRVGKQGVIECPVCKGKLHLSQSAYNGHVHGKCETADCLAWME